LKNKNEKFVPEAATNPSITTAESPDAEHREAPATIQDDRGDHPREVGAAEELHGIKFHPVTACIPEIEGQDFVDLVRDIKEHGLIQPILVHPEDDSVIDGRARVRACREAVFTGCVNAAGLLPRASADLAQVPKAKYPILTDGDVAAVQLSDCIRPKPMTGAGETSALNRRGRLAHILVAFRDDLVRSNIVFTTYNGLRLLRRHKARPTIETPLGNRAPRALDWLPPAVPMETRPEP
jgi:hypothetical protein